MSRSFTASEFVPTITRPALLSSRTLRATWMVSVLAVTACHISVSVWAASDHIAQRADNVQALMTGAGQGDFTPRVEPACVSDDSTPAAGSVYSVASGAWSDPAIWSSKTVPNKHANVVIRRCTTVRYDLKSSTPIRTLLVNGQLQFATDIDTELRVGIMVVTRDPMFNPTAACDSHESHADHQRIRVGEDPHIASFSVGTPTAPIRSGVNVRIALQSFPDLNNDCAPALIAHGGRMEFHGADLGRTWSKLAQSAIRGASQVTLTDNVKWRVGDTLLITATDFNDKGRVINGTYLGGELETDSEVRVVDAISNDGKTFAFATPLTHEHSVLTLPKGILSGEVGNLSRNVVITSADADGPYGHVMWHFGSSGSVSYTEFRDLGKPGKLGRYPVHFHRTRDSMRGTSVIGASIWGAHNRWIAVHGIEYLVVRDLVAYQTLGHGIFLEEASEQYNFLDRSLLVQSFASKPVEGQALDYDENSGACYWSANARNFVNDTVFVECGDAEQAFILDYRPKGVPMLTVMLQPDGTRTKIDASTVSGGLYSGLEFHNQRGWAFWLRGGAFPADEALQVRDLLAWRNHYTIDISGDNAVLEGVRIYFTPYGFYNNYPGSHRVSNAYLYQACAQGAFMTIRGGHGTQIYEHVRIDHCAPSAFRIDAINETGINGRPIEIHARDYAMVEPMPNVASNWAATEDTNSRTDPLLMLVMHDAFGRNADAVVLPATLSTSLAGIPKGLSFASGATVAAADGLHFAGRGATLVAKANVPFPDDHPLLHQVDRVPPATVITWPTAGERVHLEADGALTVRGVALDASMLKTVMVNGRRAKIAANRRDWSIAFNDVPSGGIEFSAWATDAAGLDEQIPHRIIVWVDRKRSESQSLGAQH